MGVLGVVRASSLKEAREAGDVTARYLARDRIRSVFVRYAFAFIVLLPTLLAAIYYSVWATDRYVSEARFVVRGISSPRTSGLDLFFRTFGISRAVDDTNAVQNFMLSRDAVRALEEQIPLRAIFSREGADALARFPHPWRGDSFEMLYEYYLERVSVIQDPSKGITVLKASTFAPEDSLSLAQALVGLAEAMVNRMNERARNDAVSAAERDHSEAEQRLISAQAALSEFRNRELVVDPLGNSATIVKTITSLSKELAAALAQAEQLRATSPSNPALRVWLAKSDALQQQIGAERSKLGGSRTALAGKVSAYEQLTLTRDLAEKSLAAAENSLELARQDARRQQVYVEEIAAPNLSDKSTDPERLRMVATVFVTCFGLFAMAWILFAGAREHAH